MGDRLILIGDVHGHYEGLCRLLDLLSPRVGDRLYFLGDLVDRGPSSASVLELVRQCGYGAVRGNHEDMMLLTFEGKQINTARSLSGAIVVVMRPWLATRPPICFGNTSTGCIRFPSIKI